MIESVYSTPKSDPREYNLLEKTGREFRIKDPGRLPSVCINCGSCENLIRVKEKLRYVNPMIILWVVLSPLALIIAYFIVKKDMNIEFERCSSCYSRKNIWSKIAIAAWLGFIAAIVLRVLFDGSLGIILAILMVFCFFLALFASAMNDAGFSVKSYSAPYFYLKGFKKTVESKLVGS